MADYGLKISKDGFDVTTADEKDLAFSSTFNTYKVYATGTGTLTPADQWSTDTAEIAHNLDYKPAFLVFVRVVTPTLLVVPNWLNPPATGPGALPRFTTWIDNTNLNIKVWGTQGDPDYDYQYSYRYYLIIDQAR